MVISIFAIRIDYLCFTFIRLDTDKEMYLQLVEESVQESLVSYRSKIRTNFDIVS